jgi:hypothetical protein
MGRPVEFDGSNLDLFPPDALAEEVIPLRVRQGPLILVSCWRLSPAEIDEIARTGVVWLAVMSQGRLPPVMVTGRRAEVI